MEFVSGWIPDDIEAPNKFGQFEAGFIARADATNAFIIGEYTPISHQGPYGSCVANATLDAYETLIGIRDPAAVRQLARMALWWLCRRKEYREKLNVGTKLGYAFDILSGLGVTAEELWPYDEEHAYIRPSLLNLEVSADNPIQGWARLYDTDGALAEAVDLSIRASHPVVFGRDICTGFRDYDGTSEVLTRTDQILGGHALMVVGTRTRSGQIEFLIRNSWGHDWGRSGYVWVNADFVTAGARNHTVTTICPDLLF